MREILLRNSATLDDQTDRRRWFEPCRDARLFVGPATGRLKILRAGSVLFLPQLPFWLARFEDAVSMPLFNLDLLLATMVACFSFRIGMALLVLAFFIDALYISSLAYHFHSPLELMDSAHYAHMVEWQQVLTGQHVLSLAAVIVCGCLTGRWILHAKRLKLWLASPLLLLCGLDVANGSTQFLGLGSDRFHVQANIVGSPIWNLINLTRQTAAMADQPMAAAAQPATYQAAVAWHRAHPTHSLLLVLVESMGQPTSAALRAWLTAQIATTRISAQWLVRQDVDAFVGSTTYGELRVLCGLQGHYSSLLPADTVACLPRQLELDGFKSIGLHGFNLHFFDRNAWWPQLGLAIGAPAPASGPAVHCNGVFLGSCDEVMLKQATCLADAPARFVYVLTLDTHLPLPPRPAALPPALSAICAAEGTDANACQMVGKLGRLLGGLEINLTAMKSKPWVAIVGDHSPPFLSRSARSAFSPSQVPLYILEPRP